MKAAIQGIRASFHDVAARKFFKDKELELVECPTFMSLFESLHQRRCDYAVMAIENALAGSILPNYSLMEKFDFKVIGEVFLKIEMCLLALPGEKLSDISYVQSHPMALLQCQDFLQTLPHAKILEHSDTAESALEIKEKNLKSYASIASRLAGETFGLEILKENIESNKANFTRFLILQRKEDYLPNTLGSKASIRFETQHVPGSLAKVLRIFESHEVNMSKIQSIPVVGRPYHYSFHVDLEWKDRNHFEKAMEELQASTLNLINFGEYHAGERPLL